MQDQMYIGAAYYPELWDKDEIEKDIARCKQAGVNVLRIGEFSWSELEPREGEFHLEWLKDVVDRLYEAGIFVVLCTPSATPPRWLLTHYPETRMVMHDLVRADVSSRCHTCKTSPIMREKNRIIVTKLCEAFAHHPGVIGWQIDNEIFPYTNGCYCENCKKAFRTYLRARFQTIDALNMAWGMKRWSLTYDSFEEIQPPYPRQWRHPSLRKAWHDFQCEQVKSYLEEQSKILHAYGCRSVGTNMMTTNALSYYRLNETLDVTQLNHYESAAGIPDTVFSYDFVRCVKDAPFWVMETQANWNGSEYAENGYRPQGACYVNTWLPFARGAQMNLYWLFRAHPNGHELGHGALFSAAGRAYRSTREVHRASEEINRCKDFLKNSCIKSKIAIHYSSTAVNSFESAPLIKGLAYRETILGRYHAAFRHFNTDVIDTAHSLDGYETVISPFLACVDENGLKERVLEWVKGGGTWIVGPMSDIMDGDVRRYTCAPYSFLEEAAGVEVAAQEPVSNDVFTAGWADGSPCSVGMCYDGFVCREGTKSLASYRTGELKGLTVVSERKVGKGKIILVGSVLSHGDLVRLTGLSPAAKASENIVLTERSGERRGIIAAETQNRAGSLCLNGAYRELITGRTLSGTVEVAPYEVLVLENI